MSYDIKLTRPVDNRIVGEEQIVEHDHETVILNRPMVNTSDVIVRINDFIRPYNFQTEVLLREDVSDQFNGNTNTIFVRNGPIYDGLKIGNISENEEDVVVRIKVEEDVSGQLTGVEDFFITEGKPILRFNNYDFNSLVTTKDVVVKINGNELTYQQITDVNADLGRIQLDEIPQSTDTVTVTYYFKAAIKMYDPINGRIVLKETPKLGQEVKVQYYSRVNDGWRIEESERSLIENARDIIFYRRKNTNRVLVQFENATPQFTGNERIFYTANKPLLPLYQSFTSTIDETLNNSVAVTISGRQVPVAGVEASTGKITLFETPEATDIVLVSYYYQSDEILDRITVDYTTEYRYCLKCLGHVNLADYKVDNLGIYEIVERENKLVQDLRKIIITVRGSDPVATWYGTTFTESIGTKIFPEIAKTRISGEIIEALTRLKNAQIQQEEYQEVTSREFLDYIQNIEVEQSEVDPSYYKATVDVVTQEGTPFEVEEPIFPEDFLYGPSTTVSSSI